VIVTVDPRQGMSTEPSAKPGAGEGNLAGEALPVELRAIRKLYQSKRGPVEALSEVNLDIEAGEFVSVVGPSGCGKSTMLMLVGGLARPTSGVVSVGGSAVERPITELGIVFQDAVLLEWRRALANVMLQIDLRRLDPAKYRGRALELLELVGLKGFEDRYPYELSGGMRQRVSLCRALVHDPPLLLMDEPFGALDALTRDQLMLDLQRIWIDARKTVLFITHSVPEAVFLSDRVVVMSARPGRILADIRIDLARPRALRIRESTQFNQFARQIFEVLMSNGVLEEHTGSGQSGVTHR
jgi:NitT/TauT family transport system ATP-binding protein